jgi:hypothetical protein
MTPEFGYQLVQTPAWTCVSPMEKHTPDIGARGWIGLSALFLHRAVLEERGLLRAGGSNSHLIYRMTSRTKATALVATQEGRRAILYLMMPTLF